ncbi:MAG TPA: hypothetical protein VGB25_10965 [Candidatus Binatia bacterium]
MKLLAYVFAAGIFMLFQGAVPLLLEETTTSAQMGDMEHMKPSSHPMDHSAHGNTSLVKLQPAEGAQVTILAPTSGQVIKGDEVPVHFRLIKGKRGDHVHAYVDGELMGMFKSGHGTLTGIQPGQHTLEVRAVAEDHQTELDATATTHFVVKY